MKEVKEKEIGLAITYRKLKKVTSVLEKMNFRDEDMVSFEYIIGSCFPDVYDMNHDDVQRLEASFQFVV